MEFPNNDLEERSFSEEEEEHLELSVNEIKESLNLKNDSEVKYSADTDDSDSEAVKSNNVSFKGDRETLNKELKCILCLDIMYKPVVASCGHSFCRMCLCKAMTKMTNEFGRFHCPSCRKQFCTKCVRRFATQRSLWSVIQILYPNLTKERPVLKEKEEFDRALKELNGEEVSAGLNKSNSFKTETLKLSEELSTTRNIGRDPNDYLMYLCICVLRSPDPLPDNAAKIGGNPWIIKVALLEMEEDEYEDSGFPLLIEDNDADTALIRSSFSGNMKMRVYQEQNSLYSSTVCCSQGVATFELKIPGTAVPGTLSVSFETSEIEYIMSEINFRCFSGMTKPPSEQKTRSKYFVLRSRNCEDLEGWDTGEEEDQEDLDEYEDDGFVVNDDEIEEESSESSEDIGEVVFIKRKAKQYKKSTKRKRLHQVQQRNEKSDKDRESASDVPDDEAKVVQQRFNRVITSDTENSSDD